MQEFSCMIFEALEQRFDKFEALKGKINDLINGTLINQIICKNCDFRSERKEKFNDISLNIKGMNNIYESL